MQPIFETCVPREDVLTGELRDEMFAARLKDVVDGVGVPVYNDAKLFLESTYYTEGLKTLIREVMGRLSGGSPANSPFIRLETSFGGGKTHNLIALFHLAQGHHEGLPKDLIPTEWIPKKPWPTVGLVGSDMEPANGIDHGSVRTHTLWGELAWQLGGKVGFKLVRASDEEGSAPGTGWLDDLVGQGPALIMLDEVARYLRVAKAVPTANKKSDLAEQTVAFLMSLIEFAASKQQVAVVMTLADSSDAFGKETETLKGELEETRHISARQERVITPTGETEISAIVTHRLFARVDHRAAGETAQAFAKFYGELISHDVELPGRAARSEYTAEIAQDYPFHPELLTVLNRKTSTIPNFQKTRGALRILARVVRCLWDKRPPGTFVITPYQSLSGSPPQPPCGRRCRRCRPTCLCGRRLSGWACRWGWESSSASGRRSRPRASIRSRRFATSDLPRFALPLARVQPGDGLVNEDGARYLIGEDLLDEPLAFVLCDLRS